MNSRSIRTATLAIPAVLVSLAGGASNAAASTATTSSASTTDTIWSEYLGAEGVVGAAAGDYAPAFHGADYAGAEGVVGAAAGTVR